MRLDRPLYGITLVLIFSSASVVLDAVSKWFTRHYPAFEITWIRFAVQTAALILVMPILGWRRVAATRVPGLQIFRGLALLVSASMFVVSLVHLPLATTVVLSFTAPLFVAILSWPILGETVGLRRWIAIVIGFIGVVVVVRPGFASVQGTMLLPLAVGIAYAIYQLMTRAVTPHDATLPTLFYACAVGFCGMSIVVPFVWVTPTFPHLLVMTAHALAVAAMHFLLIRAFAAAPASLLAPFGYVTLIWANLIDYFVFDETIDAMTIAGGVIIAIAGVLLVRSSKPA
jgi:drug/metabolite transporter (DMT)-like permease